MSSPVERLAEHIGWVENETEPYKPTPEDLRLAKALRTIITEYREAEEDYARTLDTYFEGAVHIAHKYIELLADAVNPEEKQR